MRKETSLKNGIVAIFATVTNLLFAFFTQGILVKYMGIEYQGINGLFTNLVSMLAIVELGIGPAIVYNLYKPVAENDVNKIKSLMKFYKTSYTCIVSVITVIGLLLIPFLDAIVGETVVKNVTLLYILFLVDTIASYLLTYKRSILYANQKNYIVNIVHMLYTIVLNVSQILILIFTRNFVLFLIIKVVCRIIENVALSHIASKLYSYINEKQVEPLDTEIKRDIFKKVKGLLFHKISTFVVNGTDNLLMSTFFGVSIVGMYTNYTTVITAATTLIYHLFNSILGTIGNFLVTENKEKSYNIYLKLEFLNFWIYSLMAIGFFTCIQPFINIWMGDGYLFNTYIVFALAFNLFITGMRNNINMFKNAAGIYHEDRYVPIIESLINIVASLLCIKLFGVIGIIIGTTISSSVLFLYSYPKYVFNKLFDKSRWEYIKQTCKYFSIHLITLVIAMIITKLIRFDNNFVEIVKNIVIVITSVNIIYICLFKKTEEYKYFKNIIANKLKIRSLIKRISLIKEQYGKHNKKEAS